MDCAACVRDPPGDGYDCTKTTAEDDARREVVALFGDEASAKRLYNDTRHLFDFDGTVPRFDISVEQDSWDWAHKRENLGLEQSRFSFKSRFSADNFAKSKLIILGSKIIMVNVDS